MISNVFRNPHISPPILCPVLSIASDQITVNTRHTQQCKILGKKCERGWMQLAFYLWVFTLIGLSCGVKISTQHNVHKSRTHNRAQIANSPPTNAIFHFSPWGEVNVLWKMHVTTVKLMKKKTSAWWRRNCSRRQKKNGKLQSIIHVEHRSNINQFPFFISADPHIASFPHSRQYFSSCRLPLSYSFDDWISLSCSQKRCKKYHCTIVIHTILIGLQEHINVHHGSVEREREEQKREGSWVSGKKFVIFFLCIQRVFGLLDSPMHRAIHTVWPRVWSHIYTSRLNKMENGLDRRTGGESITTQPQQWETWTQEKKRVLANRTNALHQKCAYRMKVNFSLAQRDWRDRWWWWCWR